MKLHQKVTKGLLVLGFVLIVSACGVRGAPEIPGPRNGEAAPTPTDTPAEEPADFTGALGDVSDEN